MKDMPRFRAPTAADERAYCQNCFQKFHYESLDQDTGLCGDCNPEKDDEEES